MTFAESKIVTQIVLTRLWRLLPKQALIAVTVLFTLPVFGVLTAFGVASDTQLDSIEHREFTELLTLPALAPDATKAEQFRASERVQRGDTVASLLQRLNVDDPAAFAFLRTSPEAKTIFQLRPTRTLQATTTADGKLVSLNYLYSGEEYLHVRLQEDGVNFSAEKKKVTPSAQIDRKSVV